MKVFIKKLMFIDERSEDKKEKGTHKICHKGNLKFENYKNCLEATQLQNKINHLEKTKINIDSLKNHKQFKTNNKSILKHIKKFKSERHHAITEQINKIALNSNENKRMQLIDFIEIYPYKTSKGLVNEIEVIKCNNIVK